MLLKIISKQIANKIAILSVLTASLYFTESFQFNDGLLKKRPPSCCSSEYEREAFDTLDLKLLGKEFKRLRKLNCDDCDRFGSDFAEIMRTMETRLTGKSRRYIKKIMGKPDERSFSDLVYYWRGKHDYLIFDFSKGKGATAMWHHLYE